MNKISTDVFTTFTGSKNVPGSKSIPEIKSSPSSQSSPGAQSVASADVTEEVAAEVAEKCMSNDNEEVFDTVDLNNADGNVEQSDNVDHTTVRPIAKIETHDYKF